MSQERLIKKGRLAEFEREKNCIEVKVRVNLYVLRGVFNEIEVNLDNSKFVELDLEMANVAIKDLQVLKVRYQEIAARMNEIRKDLGE